jgi:hypothetical protein
MLFWNSKTKYDNQTIWSIISLSFSIWSEQSIPEATFGIAED